MPHAAPKLLDMPMIDRNVEKPENAQKKRESLAAQTS